jgi:hypothetical protein
MPTLWITFATEDNIDGDIDYLAQEIAREGWRVRLHPLFAGEDETMDRLMPAFLARTEQSDAWILYASSRALEDGRAARIETVLRAAVAIRGDLPLIGLTAGLSETPPGLPLSHRVRVDDPEWRDRLGEAIGISIPETPAGGLQPYVAKLHPGGSGFQHILEFRPKMGFWDSFVFAVLPEEKSAVAPELERGSRDAPPPVPGRSEEGFSDDAEWYFITRQEPVNPMTSYYVFLRDMPSRLAFGQHGTGEAVILNMRSKQ